MKPFFAPYILPSDASISFEPWQRVLGDETEPLPPVVDGWAPGTTIRIRRAITIDLSEVLHSSGLPQGTNLWFNVSWIGSRSKLRERLYRAEVSDGTSILDVVLPEERIGGVVSIRTTICLARSTASSTGAATRAGSILFLDRCDLTLEGDSSSFPTNVVDFRETTYDADASWHLTISEELDASFGGQFLLEINELDTSLVRAIESDKPTMEQRAKLNSMMSGVGEILIELALHLDRDCSLADQDFDEGSTGAVLARILSRAGIPFAPDLVDPAARGDLRTLLQGAARRLGFGGEL